MNIYYVMKLSASYSLLKIIMFSKSIYSFYHQGAGVTTRSSYHLSSIKNTNKNTLAAKIWASSK